MSLSITWEKVVSVGNYVDYDGWCSPSGYIYHEGYCCLRQIKLADVDVVVCYKVKCSILKSSLNKPLFECLVENGDVIKRFMSTKPSSAMNFVFNYIGQNPKRKWNGNHFFGLHRKDVQMELSRGVDVVDASSDVSAASTAPIANKTIVNVVSDDIVGQHSDSSTSNHRKNSSTSWLGVISIGEIKEDHFRHVGTKLIYLPIGYIAARTISVPSSTSSTNTADEKSIITIHCKITELNGNVIFSCNKSISSELLGSSLNPSETVRQTLKKLHVTATRRWSGLDFFGLTRSEVINTVNAALKNEGVKKDMNSPPNKLIKSLMNVRHRNAGPTHSLMSEKSRKQRNDLIHRLVDFASFGDVKGRYRIEVIMLNNVVLCLIM